MKLISLDSSNSDVVFKRDDRTCLNISALVGRKLDDKNLKIKINNLDIQDCVINLCNLASLCYRLHIVYDSFECLELVEYLTRLLKDSHNVSFTQDNIQNKLEIDLRPFSKIYDLDLNNSIIYINKIFKDKLNFLGFADSQLINLLTQVKTLEKYIPKDLLSGISFENENTNTTYNYIKEILH